MFPVLIFSRNQKSNQNLLVSWRFHSAAIIKPCFLRSTVSSTCFIHPHLQVNKKHTLDKTTAGHPEATPFMSSVAFWGFTGTRRRGGGRRGGGFVFPFLLSLFLMLPLLLFVLFAFLLVALFLFLLLRLLFVWRRVWSVVPLFLFWSLITRWWVRSRWRRGANWNRGKWMQFPIKVKERRRNSVNSECANFIVWLQKALTIISYTIQSIIKYQWKNQCLEVFICLDHVGGCWSYSINSSFYSCKKYYMRIKSNAFRFPVTSETY